MIRRDGGVALVAALLTLAAVSTLALASFLLVRLDIALLANEQNLAIARARATSNVTLALLELERAAADGELPEVAPATPGLVVYRKVAPRVGTMSVKGTSGSGRVVNDLRFELRTVAGEWRVAIVDER